ncbi:hypothetical protein TUBRATIS_26710 [Tubulinosema ratisbonensis]|uniref:Uncharacterized protein n=1 Tax=Tubulinosema ratisbonensis TaxID=291195 RepID=A0A437AIC7_9MICR|nr:hypothetical protein TUBRATIS_26710 [Tubulinosema ratisbonensis]
MLLIIYFTKILTSQLYVFTSEPIMIDSLDSNKCALIQTDDNMNFNVGYLTTDQNGGSFYTPSNNELQEYVYGGVDIVNSNEGNGVIQPNVSPVYTSQGMNYVSQTGNNTQGMVNNSDPIQTGVGFITPNNTNQGIFQPSEVNQNNSDPVNNTQQNTNPQSNTTSQQNNTTNPTNQDSKNDPPTEKNSDKNSDKNNDKNKNTKNNSKKDLNDTNSANKLSFSLLFFVYLIF